MTAMLERLVQWWAALQTRERRMLSMGGVVLAVLSLYFLAFEPAYVGRQRVQSELPALRAQLAQMEALGTEARQLSAKTGESVESPAQLKESLEKSIKAAGLTASLTQLNLAGELIDLRFRGASFAVWLTWLDSALRETRLRIVDVSLERDADPGKVTARLTLELPRRP